LNDTHQLLLFSDDINLLDEKIHTIKKNTKALFVSSKEIFLEVNGEKKLSIYFMAL
jgi:hypothetical protein